MSVLLASDYDGTLFFHDRPYSKRDLKAIERFQKAGNKFALNTGRNYRQVVELYPYNQDGKEHPIHFDLYIHGSGGTVLDEKQEILSSHDLDFDTVKTIIEENPDARAALGVDGHMLFVKNDHHNTFFDFIPRVHSVDELEGHRINTLSLSFKDVNEAKKAKARIEELNLPISAHINQSYIDCAARNISKATGLEEAGAYFDIPENHWYAVGDSFNDLPALLRAKKGFLISSAYPELIKWANENNVEIVDDVAQAIEWIEKNDPAAKD